MKTVIYCRISTDKQSHDSQLLELRSYCQRRGWADVVEFEDTITGSKFSRRGLDALFAEVRKGKVARIVVFKLDRLGRSLAHLAQLVAELAAHGTALICTSQGIDTSDTNPAGRLQLGVLMAVAEFEREIIRERVNAGLAAARARGAKLGRPNTPWTSIRRPYRGSWRKERASGRLHRSWDWRCHRLTRWCVCCERGTAARQGQRGPTQKGALAVKPWPFVFHQKTAATRIEGAAGQA